MSVSKIIEEINKKIPDCFSATFYGLAQSVVRSRGTEFEVLPGLVGDNGDIEYVGLDDDEPMILYHKCNSITCGIKQGTGDSYDVSNIYNNCLIVWSDRSKTHKRPDELLLFIQANFPSTISLVPYKTILVKFASVVLNDQIVFDQEYNGTAFRLPSNNNLFQINYTIESIFNKKCFEKCPTIN